MQIGEILRRLHKVKRSGAGWMARCPAHQDKTPSLSVSQADGKILLNCQAGCETASVLKAVGLEFKDLFIDESPGPQKRIVAVYDYRDETGKLLYQEVRYEPKDFRVRRPDGKGGWVWNLGSVRRVPYNLPEVIKTQEVFVVEGPKDAETARKLGLVATCNAGGAGKWRPEYAGYLKGKDVVIVGDADAPGQAHCRSVAKSLLLGVAASVKLIEALPGVDHHGDLSDFAEKFPDVKTCRKVLDALIADTKPLTPEDVASWGPPKSAATGGIVLTDLCDLISEPEEVVTWLWEGILPAGGLSLIGAKPKTGKSTFARCLTLAVSRGEDFLGHGTQKGAVIYLALEEKRSGVRKHFQMLGAASREECELHGWKPVLIHVASAPKEALSEVTKQVREHAPALLVIDPLLRFTRVKDVSDYAEITAAMEPLLVLSRENNVHVMLVHHLGKGERTDVADAILGSTAFRAAVDTNLIMRRFERYRTLQTEQRYGEDMEETVLTFDKETGRLEAGGTRFDSDLDECKKKIMDLLRGSGEPLSRTAILKGIEVRPTVTLAALKALVDAGQVERSGAGTKGHPFVFAANNNSVS